MSATVVTKTTLVDPYLGAYLVVRSSYGSYPWYAVPCVIEVGKTPMAPDVSPLAARWIDSGERRVGTDGPTTDGLVRYFKRKSDLLAAWNRHD